ncbi:MAG: MOSC domain-containing protein [Candidatus Aminicenantia bacterium]
MEGKVVSICKSERRGRKKECDFAIFKENWGIEGDFHAGSEREVSILPLKSIEKMKEKLSWIEFGNFGENLVIDGLDFENLKIGDRLKIGEIVEAEIVMIGKDCHERCLIYYQTGECIMPGEGIFLRILKGGIVKRNDTVIMVE